MLYNSADYNEEDSFIVANCKKIFIDMTFIMKNINSGKEFDIPIFQKEKLEKLENEIIN